jgi:hypothetical protein
MTSLAHTLRLKIDANATNVLDNALNVYIYRIANLCGMAALAAGTRRVTETHVASMAHLLNMSATAQAGGSGMASDFYGYQHPSFGQGGLNMSDSTLNFATQQARPGLSEGMMGGGASAGAIIKQQLRDRLKTQKITITPGALAVLVRIVQKQIHELVLTLKGRVTPSKIATALRQKQFALFA